MKIIDQRAETLRQSKKTQNGVLQSINFSLSLSAHTRQGS